MQKRYFHRFWHTVDIQLDVSVLRGADCQPIHFISQIQDITSRIEREEALQHRALTDDLTGLPNRRAFMDERSEEHTSELQSLMRISYAVFCFKKKKDKE